MIGVEVAFWHEMVYVVAPVSGTVAAAPESVDSEKLPSGDVSVQLATPCVFQKIDVREPSGTVAGTAQICTTGVPVGTGAAGVAAGGVDAGPCWSVTCGGVAGGGVPTWNPCH